MNCRDVQDRLSGFADHDLPSEEAALVAAHLEGCGTCRDLLADLTRVRDAAAALGPIAPPDHLSLEIAGQIRLDAPGPIAAAPQSTLSQWMGLAAAVVIITTGAYAVSEWVWPDAGPAAPASVAADADGTGVGAVVEELGAALEKAIADLQALAQASDRPGEAELAGGLLENLKVIDGAIAESRMALAEEPSSVAARDSLLEALKRKVGVLQSTMALINDLRLGNAEGAGESMSGLGKKS